ncbi:Outer membrane efflux protein, partial [Candidatus Omnitrophus magneticus]
MGLLFQTKANSEEADSEYTLEGVNSEEFLGADTKNETDSPSVSFTSTSMLKNVTHQESSVPVAIAASKEDAKKNEAIQKEVKPVAKILSKKNILEQKIAQYENLKNKLSKKADKYIFKARYYLSKGNYKKAREFAFKANEKSPQSEGVKNLMNDVSQEEMIKQREKSEKELPAKLSKTQEKVNVDLEKIHGEGPSWMDILAGKTDKELKPIILEKEKNYSINQCVYTAMVNSPRINMSLGNIRLSEFRVFEAYRNLFPSLTLRKEMSSGRIGADGMVRHYRGDKYQVGVKQTLFDGMEKWFALRQAKTNVDLIKFEHAKIIDEIVFDTKKAYYSLDKSIKALEIQKKFRENVKKYYDQVDKLNQSQLVTRAEYLKVKAQDMQADFQVISSEE